METGTNAIEDPCIRALYDGVTLVSEGPLLSADRFAAIRRLGWGSHRCAPAE